MRDQEQSYLMSSLRSPTPTISDEDYLSNSSSSTAQLKEQLDQLEFDKDEVAAKYSDLEEKYEKLKAHYNDMKVTMAYFVSGHFCDNFLHFSE